MELRKFETNFNKGIFMNESILQNVEYLKDADIVLNEKNLTSTILGFGGAITEASGYCYHNLSEEEKKNFINSIKRSNYTFFRLPIGSSDFSLSSYSYVEKKDLSDFSIERDLEYIVPLLKDIMEVTPNIKLLASPWSPPKFMKTTNLLVLGGKLKKKYRKLYAEYLAKYVLEYKKLGINIDYITPQNEPGAVQVWESCLYSSEEEKEFIKDFLFPTFKENNIETKIIIYDHNKDKLLKRALDIYEDTSLLQMTSGLGFHNYEGNHFEALAEFKKHFPDKLLIHTEGCVGFSKFKEEDEIKNAEYYLYDLIGDLNNGANGYIDWNILLDEKGGPNHKRNYCNSPIMVRKNTLYKNLCYFYITHITRFILPNAKKIEIISKEENLDITSFKNEDGEIIIVILNKTNNDYSFKLNVLESTFSDTSFAHSIQTYIVK